jgi:hypothetical protein
MFIDHTGDGPSQWDLPDGTSFDTYSTPEAHFLDMI